MSHTFLYVIGENAIENFRQFEQNAATQGVCAEDQDTASLTWKVFKTFVALTTQSTGYRYLENFKPYYLDHTKQKTNRSLTFTTSLWYSVLCRIQMQLQPLL